MRSGAKSSEVSWPTLASSGPSGVTGPLGSPNTSWSVIALTANAIEPELPFDGE